MLSQKCNNCTFYTAYYKQWSDHYGKLNHGFCSKTKKQQQQYDSCEDFKSNEQKKKMRQERMLDSLELALESINHISQIMKEKQNDHVQI